MDKKKLFFVTTVPISLIFFKGQLSYLKQYFDIEIVSSSGKFLEETCLNEKVKGNVIEMKREISILKDIKSLYKLIKLFKIIKPDIIHGGTPKAGLLSMIAGWISGVPNRIYYIHGLRYQGDNGIKKQILIVMEKLTCYFATNIFSVSNGVKKQLTKDRITSKKITIIGNGSVNGIDTNYFSKSNKNIPILKDDFGIDGSHYVYGFIGRLVKDKGINELVYAFLQINKTKPNTKLVLVGNYEDSLDPLEPVIINEITTNKNIIHVGFQKDVRPFLKIMHTFVFPSYREGFGISLMEASAMEIPCISSNIIGCNEIITNMRNGLLIEPKSVMQLKNAMIRLLEDKKLYKQMKKATRNLIIEKYNQKKVWKKTLLAYKNIVN